MTEPQLIYEIIIAPGQVYKLPTVEVLQLHPNAKAEWQIEMLGNVCRAQLWSSK